MTFTEKLARLTADRNKSVVARAAGLPATAISNYISRKYIPRADTALKIARALDVPIEWMLDNSQGFPAPPVSSLLSLSTEQLAAELGRRLLPLGIVLFSKIAIARKVNWIKIVEELLAIDPDAKIPNRLREAIAFPAQINALASELDRYDPRAPVGETASPEVRKAASPASDLSLIDLWRRCRDLQDEPGFNQVTQLTHLFTAPKEWRPPWFAEHVGHLHKKVRAELDIARYVAANTPPNASEERAARKKNRD